MRHIKRVIIFCANIAILLGVLSFSVIASESQKSNIKGNYDVITYKFGENVTGVLDQTGVLTISGRGQMYDFARSEEYASSKTPLSPVYENKSIKKIVINEGIVNIGDCAFYSCLYNREISVAGTVKEIGNDAFYGNRYLKKVILKNGVEIINACAFMWCDNLEELSLPNSLKRIESSAFYAAFHLKSIKLPEGLQYLGSGALGGCVLLTEINIPGSLREMESDVFGACHNIIGDKKYMLKNIYCVSSNPVYTSVNGVLYSKDKTELVWYPEGRQDNSYDVLPGTRSIGKNSMCNEFIKKIKLPESVIDIDNRAFSGALALESINIPNKVNSIGEYAFEACWKLKELRIPQSVNSIGVCAFTKCLTLEDIYFYGDPHIQYCFPSNGTYYEYYIFYMSNEKLKVHMYRDSMINNYMNAYETNMQKVFDLPNRYKIKYVGNGSSSGSMSSGTDCLYGTSYKLKANKFVKKGYTFKGWNTKKDGTGKKYSDRCEIKNLSNKDGTVITLYAQWEKTVYPIQYVLNGGKNSKKNPHKYSVTSSTIKLQNPTRKGYVFQGWYKKNNYSGKTISSIRKGTTGNKIFYAKWKPNRYTIKFNGNGSTSGTMKSLNKCKYGQKYKLENNTFKRKGFKFIGWNTKPDGSGKLYKNGESVKNLTSKSGKVVTLYAQWRKNKH